ncbi:MAG: C2H2-type zinc finger protein [Nitrosopumilus sp.]|nr:MAG: C2H2-type zinc finger protein [Nitrosopumilus sp.]
MLTIDCRDVVSMMNELLVYVADQMAAIPTLKHNQFTLSALDDDDVIDANEAVSVIREYLNSIDQGGNFAVISNDNMINIKSLSGKIFKSDTAESRHNMFSCTHCGFITQYEVELNTHMKIHYI